MKEMRSTAQTLSNQSQFDTRELTGKTRLLERLSTRILAWFVIPEGYQDENGFHFGPQPDPRLAATATVLTDRADQAFIYASANAPQPTSMPQVTAP